MRVRAFATSCFLPGILPAAERQAELASLIARASRVPHVRDNRLYIAHQVSTSGDRLQLYFDTLRLPGPQSDGRDHTSSTLGPRGLINPKNQPSVKAGQVHRSHR